MAPKQPDDPGTIGGDDRFFSGEPLSQAEWRAIRRMLAGADEIERERIELRNMLEAYKLAGKFGRAAWIVGAWIVGAFITLLGILTAIRTLGWWHGP